LKVLEAIDKRDEKLKVHYGNDQYNYPCCGNFGQRRTNNIEEVTCESCLRLMGKKNNDFPKRSQSFSAYRSKNLVCLTIKFKPMLPEEAAVLTDDIMERYSKHLKDGKMKEEENEAHDSRE
jgi:delta-aminolevulinic acid dehydratase/porphobilinogen synthase